ncbi:hypothetical protein [Burkholderia pseudomallei]|uniref:hypothetical protein n=1 Tax=Burkholderia pseudomallei TaxID=28450 RepID=UPI0005DC6F6E|nr:hypothetical protein [Burkholderia pseudomallei]CAK1281431.1 Uncharacterised protein [Burkholderia pseudomallei]CAK1319124.1 Uncharacterised protein [Burkholderia pseudomallei]CAK1320213.1 Uncharacterised protein [Burkholderia pseudomallei]CFK95590.1 Uncharacterised protein [Burkholderia pseudomallei]CFL02949.1 Uncharacterised protein [Burkholderia pseudomallei]
MTDNQTPDLHAVERDLLAALHYMTMPREVEKLVRAALYGVQAVMARPAPEYDHDAFATWFADEWAKYEDKEAISKIKAGAWALKAWRHLVGHAAASQGDGAAEPVAVPAPDNDILIVCGWNEWRPEGYVDRGTAERRYQLIAGYVLSKVVPPKAKVAASDKSRADGLTDLSNDELALIREEAARITDDWCERQLMDPSPKESDAKFVREVLRLAASPSSQPAAAPIYPQGVMGIPPYSPSGSGQSQATSALTWNAPAPADERAAFVERVMGMFEAWPNGKPGPTDEPESHYRFGYNTALEDVLTALDVGSPTRRAASANETGAEGAAIELLRKFMEYRDSDYVPNVLFDCARTIIDNAMAAAAPADERASGMPDEVRDSMMDSQYLAGVTAGWNAANADDPNAALKKIHDAYSGYLNPLRDWQKAGRPGAPATPAMADERAECIAWANANGFPKYHESMCAAWEERARRAAASPAAEAVTITDAEAEMLVGIKKFHTHDFGRGPELHADAITDAYKRGRAAAPQPAQADAPVRIEALRKGLFNARDALRTIYEHGVTRNTPIWQWIEDANCVLNGEQADAPAEAREPIAWVTDDDRAITAAQKQRALADGGATASSVRPYSIPCYAVSAPADAGEARLTDAARDMLAERRRQVEAEGWTPEHDDQYQHGAIALAAACYAANAGGVAWADPLPSFWPWMHNWWKPTTPRRDLVKAGALILAELERLDRAALLNGADHDQ